MITINSIQVRSKHTWKALEEELTNPELIFSQSACALWHPKEDREQPHKEVKQLQKNAVISLETQNI